MALNLMADSEAYARLAKIYDRFSEAEDADGKVFDTLLPLLAGENVLDLGCGTGKYLALFAPHVRHITGIDAAPAQLACAREKAAGFPNVTLIECDAADIPEPEEKYDIIIATWVLGTILDATHRARALNRMRQCLAPNGRILLVENDAGGMFEELRGRVNDPSQRTHKYNQFLLGSGFTPLARFESRFCFASVAEARGIFSAIWGEAVGNKVQSETIPHRIVILTSP